MLTSLPKELYRSCPAGVPSVLSCPCNIAVFLDSRFNAKLTDETKLQPQLEHESGANPIAASIHGHARMMEVKGDEPPTPEITGSTANPLLWSATPALLPRGSMSLYSRYPGLKGVLI